MKLILALCLLGAALVVAEPYYGYGGYRGWYGKRSAEAEPAPQYYVPVYGYYGYYGKRSADAEPAPQYYAYPVYGYYYG